MKRIISFLIILALLMPLGVAAEVSFESNQNKTKSNYEFELNLMKDMKVMDAFEDGSMQPERLVSRSEYVVMLMRLMDYDSIKAIGNSEFDDVGSRYWAYDSIMLARELGYIAGSEDNLFHPDTSITYIEALKITLCALGYDLVADLNGGWAQGYITTAITVGMTKGISCDFYAAVSNGVAARILYNTLDTEIMTDMLNGEYRSGETLFDSRYANNGWQSGEGMVTANYDTAIMENVSLEENEIVIDGIKYECEGINTSDFLGMNVKFYVHDDSGAQRLISIFPDERNTVLELSASSIEQISLKEISYYKSESVKNYKAKLYSPKVIINGELVNGLAADADLTFEEGSIRAIDNNGDDAFDVLFINSCRDFVVDYVSVENNLLYLKNELLNNKKAIDLDPNDADIHFSMKKNGKECELSEIKEKDIITVYISPNSKRVNIIVCDRIINGSLNGYSTDYETILIDEKEYQTTEAFKSQSFQMTVGRGYKFFLNAADMVTYVDKADAETDIGYAYLFAYDLNRKFNGGLELKVLLGGKTYEVDDEIDDDEDKTITEAQNLNFKVYETAEKIRIDGQTYQSSKAYPKMGDIKVFTFKTDSDGKITAIDTVEQFGIKEERVFNKSIKSFGKTLNQAFQIDDKTEVFLIAGSSVDDDYFVRVQIEDASNYVVEGFGRRYEDEYVVDCLVLYDPTMVSVIKNVDEKADTCIVTEIKRVIDEDYDTNTMLTMYQKGVLEKREIKRTPRTADAEKELRVGTIMRYTEDSYNRIDNIEIVAQSAELDEYFNLNEHSASETVYAKCMSEETRVLSNIRNAFVDRIGLSVSGEEADEKLYNATVKNGPGYYVYNKSKGTVEIITPNEIASGENCGVDDADNIFIHAVNDDVRIVVVVR